MTTSKTIQLTGAALDWAVAKCEGLPLKLDPMGFGRDSPKAPQSGWWVWFGTPFSMIVGYVQKNNKDQRGYSPSTDWAQGGPIIERAHICIKQGKYIDTSAYIYKGDGYAAYVQGPTPLIAAMRCYVTSKLGDEVEVPEELV